MTQQSSIGVGILGGTGYGAGELLRLLVSHPEVTVTGISSRKNEGEHISTQHPHLEGFYPELSFSPELSFEELSKFEKRFIFSGLPHGVTGETVTELAADLSQYDVHLIDLSGAHRLRDTALHAEHYPTVNRSDALVSEFTYGLSELNKKEITTARHIANPGCLATASVLALAPLRSLLTPKFIAFDTKTGSTGSGRELKETTHHPTRHGNFTAYKPLAHQHEPEVVACLQAAGLKECETSFIAQSLPIARGIYVTTHIQNSDSLDATAVVGAIKDFADAHYFVRYREKPPHLQHVLGTNFCDISCAVKDNTVIVMTAIDNLVKGMAGQAIQNMNIIAGLPEEIGLQTPSLRPY